MVTAPKLLFTQQRKETPAEYTVYRCEGVHGCGERLTDDALGEHAAKQHNNYDYEKTLLAEQDG
jgi:hypothetical protein